MSQHERQQRQALRAMAQQWEAKLTRRLWWVFAVSIMAAVITGALMAWDAFFPVPPERVVKVYWTHTCTCVFGWMKSLEDAGFIVKSVEYDTLKHIRSSLQMPSNLQGCHVGAYLGYFLEGHVTPAALNQLAVQRPQGEGLITQAALSQEAEHRSAVLDEQSPVRLVDGDTPTIWFVPPPLPVDKQTDSSTLTLQDENNLRPVMSVPPIPVGWSHHQHPDR